MQPKYVHTISKEELVAQKELCENAIATYEETQKILRPFVKKLLRTETMDIIGKIATEIEWFVIQLEIISEGLEEVENVQATMLKKPEGKKLQ